VFFWISRLARHPRLLLVLVFVLAAGALALCVDPRTLQPRFKVDPSAEALLPAQDSDRAVFAKVRQTFGEDDPVIVAVHFEPTVFTSENLEKIALLTQRLRQLPGVRSVFSLATAPSLMLAQLSGSAATASVVNVPSSTVTRGTIENFTVTPQLGDAGWRCYSKNPV